MKLIFIERNQCFYFYFYFYFQSFNQSKTISKMKVKNSEMIPYSVYNEYMDLIICPVLYYRPTVKTKMLTH